MPHARGVVWFLFAAGMAPAQQSALHCWVGSTPPIVRSSGLTEAVGDIVLGCTGGRPTPHGQQVQQVNLQIFLPAPVTSRLVGDFGESEAVLLVDEPKPGLRGNQLLCTPGQPILGSGNGTSTYDGSGPNHCNVFRGQQVGDNSLTWLGLPVDPPGNATRILRIKNVRINAGLLSGTGMQPIQAFISVSPSSSLPLVAAQVAVGFVRRAVTAQFSDAIELNLRQCGPDSDASNYSVTVSEGFASAFRRRSLAVSPDNDSSPPPLPNASPEDGGYATETGFYNPALGDTTGLADAGTRIAVRFTGAGQGALLTVPLAVELKSGSAATGILRLVMADDSGRGPFRAVQRSAATIDGVPAATLSVDGDIAQAVYETLLADPAAIETATIPIRIGCNPASTPQAGEASVSVILEPVSDIGRADRNSPVPRFKAAGEAVRAYTRSLGGCTLLFPFVTQRAGVDTGIAISNTSLDPFGTNAEAGSVILNFYGSAPEGGSPPRRQVSDVVPAGGTLTFTLSGGGNYGIAPVAGFQGYVIAQANFAFCHGLAFIVDVNAARLAEGYLGLVLNGKGNTSRRLVGFAEALLH